MKGWWEFMRVRHTERDRGGEGKEREVEGGGERERYIDFERLRLVI